MPAAVETDSTEAVIALLAERWPKAFFVPEAKRKPLKVGVHLEIIAALDGAVTETKLSIALDCYVTSDRYLSRCTVAGAKRIDLCGLPSGEVTAKEANYAKNRLSMAVWNAKAKERPTWGRRP